MPDLPAGRKGADMPIVSGKIIITGSNGEQVSVPYFGMFMRRRILFSLHGI